MKFTNEAVEGYKAFQENKNRLAKKEIMKIDADIKNRESFMKKYNDIRLAKFKSDKSRSELMEAARNDALSTVVKAIYIGALEGGSLTDDNLILAESMVDNWIKESGGASKILGKVGNNTYLLSRITQIVEEAAQETVKDIEAGEDEIKDTPANRKEVAMQAVDDFMKDASKADIAEFMKQIFSSKSLQRKKRSDAGEKRDTNNEEELQVPEDDEESADNTKDMDFSDDDSDENGNDEDGDGVDDDTEEENDEETDEELGEPLDSDGIDQDTTIDGSTENKGKIYDELDSEEDVQKAVEIIRDRIASAEETFIRNNAEDKKKIEELLAKISNNAKTVADMSGKDDTKAAIAEESARMYKRQIDAIKENRPLTIFEKMNRNLSKSILKNEVVRESYLTEAGSLDTSLIVETSKVMYGFLETLNTLQLEKVDPTYIKNVLDNMR